MVFGNLKEEEREAEPPSLKIRSIKSLMGLIFLINLSYQLILILERFLSSQLNIQSMNAMAIAGMTVSIFHFGLSTFVASVEVLVGEANGANRLDRAPVAVWQMLWFTIAIFIMVFPWVPSIAHILIPSDQQHLTRFYFESTFTLCLLTPASTAIISFFIGIDKIKYVSYLVVGTFILNVFLDLVLFERYGINALAFGNSVSRITLFLSLLAVFFHKNTHRIFKTRKPSFDLNIMKQILSIGGPSAVSYVLDMSAWNIVARMVNNLGPVHMAIYTVGETLTMMLNFYCGTLR